MSTALYRAVFGGYDFPPTRDELTPEIDYYLFTDNGDLNVNGYTSILVTTDDSTPSELNRKYKLSVPCLLKDYENTIYLDGNIRIVGDLNILLTEFRHSGSDIGSFSHPENRSVEQEARAILQRGKASERSIQREIEALSEQSRKLFVYDNSIIFRSAKSQKLDKLGSAWFQRVRRYSGRDQLSFPSLLKDSGLAQHVFPFSPRNNGNGFFVVYPHKSELMKGPPLRRGWKLLRFIVKEIRARAQQYKNKEKKRRIRSIHEM